MEPTQRRGFLRLAATTAVGIPFADALGFTLSDSRISNFSLRTSDVKQGLEKGLQFRPGDQQVLKLVKKFSSRQVMIGGGVLTLAANQPTEAIHLLVQLDDLDEFVNTIKAKDAPWSMGRSSYGNVLSFDYEGQQYHIETLVGEEFTKRLASLDKPGSEVNGFRVEFAHDGVRYDLQQKRFDDPHGVLRGDEQVAMVPLVAPNGLPSAIRILVEEKSLGLSVADEDKKTAARALREGIDALDDDEKSRYETVAGLSRLSRYVGQDEMARIMA